MKIFSILFLWISASVLSACSSELLDGSDASNGPAEGYTSITLLVENPDEDDRHVNNMVALVYDGGVRVGLAEWVPADGAMSMTVNDLRVGSVVNVYVLANTRGNRIDGRTNDATDDVVKTFYNEQALLNANTDLTQETARLMKVGSYRSYRMQPQHNEITVPLGQVAAWVDFDALTVDFTDGDASDAFFVTSVQLENVQETTFVYSDNYGAALSADPLVSVKNQEIAYLQTITDLADFYTFANQDAAQPVTLVINGKMKQFGLETDRTFRVAIGDNDGNPVRRGYKYVVRARLTGKMSAPELHYQVVAREPIAVTVPDFC